MSGLTPQLLRNHAARCAKLSEFQPDTRPRNPEQVRADLADLFCRELNSLVAAKPSIDLMADSERGIFTHAAAFVLNSFPNIRDPHAFAGFKARVDAVLAVTFDEDPDLSAFGSARKRIVGLPRGTDVTHSFKRGANAVHEILHAAAPVIVKEVEKAETPGAYKSAHIVSDGWTVYKFGAGPGPATLFRVFEEVAVEAQSSLYYQHSGLKEQRVEIPVTINLRPSEPLGLALFSAAAIISPAGMGSLTDTPKGQAYPFTFTAPSVQWDFRHGFIRSAYSIMIPAMDDLAAEIFPNMPPELAAYHQRDLLREIQAFGQHRRYLKPLMAALGAEGRTFLAELQPPSKYDPRNINNILLVLFVAAGRLPDIQKRMARSLLREAQLALQQSLET